MLRLRQFHASPAQCDVVLNSDEWIFVGPAFTGFVDKNDPDQVVFPAFVDQEVGISLAFRGEKRYSRI